MPIEKKPLHPVSKEQPKDSIKYHVQNDDSWGTVAKSHNIDIWDLIYFNFRTKIPSEINWYLNHYVGCKKITRDGKNWMFSKSADPGNIYIPMNVEQIEMPPEIIEHKPPKEPEIVKPPILSSLWAGFGKSHSGDFFLIGAHDMTGLVFNLGDVTGNADNVRNAYVNINGYKFGPGLGACIGGVVVIAHGYDYANEMNGVSGSWDFDIALGPRLKNFLVGVKGLGGAINTYEKYKKLRYLTENAVKNIGITKPGIYTIPMPYAGYGYHLWGGYKFGDVKVISQGHGLV